MIWNKIISYTLKKKDKFDDKIAKDIKSNSKGIKKYLYIIKIYIIPVDDMTKYWQINGMHIVNK